MSTRMVTRVVLACFVASLAAASGAQATPSSGFCNRLGHSIQASSGAQMYCSPPAGSLVAGASRFAPFAPTAPAGTAGVSANVDAASFSEDISPSGVRGYGQSETSIAASGPYVVEAWNDATGFFSPCPSPQNKEELTGLGFSSNGGASFTDLGGPPNAACNKRLLAGDPSVGTWTVNGTTYFYITSLYPSISGDIAPNQLALSVCKVRGSGTTASLSCGQPIVVASSTSCEQFFGCSFLDKEFLTIDPTRGRLYVSYTDFGVSQTTFSGAVDLSTCDLGTPSGATGPAGGAAGQPVCEHGTSTRSYLVVAPADPYCESEGAYPAVSTASGDVYVGYEFNWGSNLFGGPCATVPTRNILKRVPASCLVLTATSPCAPPSQSVSQKIVSMDSAFLPGYNRFPASDFPRVAVVDSAGTVSMVWNDAGANPLGDILLRSYHLGTLAGVQGAPVRLNPVASGLHFLPAVRNASASGKLGVSWYDRGSATTTLTDVRADLSLDPRLTSTPASSTLITSTPSDWAGATSDIVPNFGDYTDNYANSGRLFLAWSDGRLGVPQPFEASVPMP